MKIRYFLRRSKENFVYSICQLNNGFNKISIYINGNEFKKNYKTNKNRRIILFNDILGNKLVLLKQIELNFLNNISYIIFEVPNVNTKFMLPIRYKNINKNILLIKSKEFFKVGYYKNIIDYFVINVNKFFIGGFKSVFLSDLNIKALNIDKRLVYMNPLIFVIKKI